MPDVLGSPPSPRAALFWNGTQWQWARVAATGHLRIDVMGSALPAGAATAANQALILAQTQLIEDLRHALQSVATDRLKVRGEDQLISYRGALTDVSSGVPSGAGGFRDSAVVAAGTLWKVTAVSAADSTAPLTRVILQLFVVPVALPFHDDILGVAANIASCWNGEVWIGAGWRVRAYFIGSGAADVCTLHVMGHIMTVET